MAVQPKIFIVIVNYNGKNVIDRCLQSVFSQRYKNIGVVVVDNDSQDGSLEFARRRYSRVHYIAGKKNRGFGGGANLGISFAMLRGAEYIFILNNDAWIEEDTLQILVRKQQEQDNTLLLSPIILNDSGDIWFCGGRIDWWRMRATHTMRDKALVGRPCNIPTEYVSGCAFLAHKNFFKTVGNFDERFFLYYEDVDLSVRARRKGFLPSIALEATAHHSEKSNTTNPRKVYWLVLSGLFFFWKQDSFVWKLWHFLYFLARKCKNRRDRIKYPNSPAAKHVFQAYTKAKESRSLYCDRGVS